jgi:hypothetical protein
MHRREFGLACVAGALALGQSLHAADKARWGDLTATFVYDGEPPERRPLRVDKDRGLYKDPILDPSLIVDAKTKGIANVVGWLHMVRGASPPAIHPGYEKSAKDEIVIDTIRGNIEPHVCLLRTSQTLHTKNSEPIGHHLNCHLFPPPNLISASGSRKLQLKPESSNSQPAPVACSIHPWENGYLLVRDHPYMALSNDQGQLTINNLPVGKHTFTFWHERSGFITAVKRDGKAEKWKLGRLEVDIKPGRNDLGVIVCDSKQFR